MTREPLDPVRLVTNRSSGKMGFRLAQAAWYRGALVRLITGPSAEPEPVGVTLTRIETTKELEESVREALPVADVLIMAAAPADFRPADASATKRPREGGRLTIELCPTVDILTGTAELRKPDSVTVGFALETGDAEAKARAKLARKGLDLIVVNDALEAGAGFEVDTNRVTVLDRDGGRWELPLASKAEVAEWILDRVEARLG
jgi:phosphopantothenoylcysteine decarboxylase/phosphopantothenate--cysteine ligase